ncbi:sensor histidine kinase [Siminovitchia fortis]|uniref:histidine kinase n=1 Tax=Siminovitchia fortis TaxID=254758 RepID=A0A443IWW8_9BACI|nr:sensor histidine kinase [Siminovitchia fortis]RWR12569.1 HAMP domain-containing histidine kinase [Siminovitchia fortis]WHY81484.1 sensor histidine kinase [Siminovitchia fortis]
MLKKFLIERRSWILLFLFTQLLLLFIAYIDSSIPINSIIYIVFLSFMIFMIFLAVRYNKETPFYKSLKEWDGSLDLSEIDEAVAPFEKIVEHRIKDQTERQTEVTTANRIALEQERDDLLSWIHEVKTPLTAMHLIIERLEDDKIKAQLTYEWLRIHLLLDQQLHQKRISFIENDLHVEKIALEPLVFKEIKNLQSWCMQKGIGFEVDLKADEVLSDEKWLAFIIRQLLTNAVKYSEESDIIIKSKKDHDQTFLEVQDFGRGIDPKDLPRIFDKGFTSTTHPDRAATGMGLYLAKKAAESLLIQIHVRSQPGRGTIFALTFPKPNEFVNLTRM